MLKELLALNESAEVSREMQANFNRTASEVRKALKSFFEQKETVKVEVLSANSAKFTIDFNYWLREETIRDVHQEFEDAIKKADVNGHIKSIEEGASHGDQYTEALLTGLRPGMKLKAEAFFPTAEKIVTWQVVTRRPKK